MTRYLGFVRMAEGITEPPPQALFEAMDEFISRSAAAGIFLDGGGLYGTEDAINFVPPVIAFDTDHYTVARYGLWAYAAAGITGEWYRDGEPIPGATGMVLIVTEEGFYTVEHHNEIGCGSTSAPVEPDVSETEIGVPLIEGAPGELVVIPLELLRSKNLPEGRGRSFEAELLAMQLRDEHPTAVLPGYHMNKQHWNTVICDGSVPGEEIAEMIAHAYGLVRASLPKRAQAELP